MTKRQLTVYPCNIKNKLIGVNTKSVCSVCYIFGDIHTESSKLTITDTDARSRAKLTTFSTCFLCRSRATGGKIPPILYIQLKLLNYQCNHSLQSKLAW